MRGRTNALPSYPNPPIVEAELRDYLADTYESPYFFDARVFKENKFEVIELGKVFRQKDSGFIELLNKVRNNDLEESDLVDLNRRCDPSLGFEKGDLAITLTSTNRRASAGRSCTSSGKGRCNAS